MLTQRLEFVVGRAVEVMDTIPAAPAVFLLRGDDPSSQPYVSKSANLRRRLHRLLGPTTGPTRKLNLRELVSSVEYTPIASEFESGLLLYRILRHEFPETHSERLRLRPAPLVKLHLENAHPRASVTTRVGRLNSLNAYYGPFFSRASAERFCNDSLDFFRLRRCVDDLSPDPNFPGCIYSEMKMCLAPCFNGCTPEEYRHESQRVQAYFQSKGDSLVRELSVQRDEASSNTNFEEAAAVHSRLDKLRSLLAQLPEIVHRLDLLNAVMVQASVIPGCVSLFRIYASQIFGPIPLQIRPENHARSQSMEARIQEALALLSPQNNVTAQEVSEHLALLRRWFYRTSRTGEIFFADDKGNLPMRRMVRGISRVFNGESVPTTEHHQGQISH